MPEVQSTPAPEATTPNAGDLAKALAERATAHLDKDRVTPSQAKAYTEFLAGETPFSEMDNETLAGLANTSLSITRERRAELKQSFSHLVPSHQWLKAIAATALQLRLDAEAEAK